MVLAEPPASKWVGFWGSFQPEKKLECHPFLNSQPLPYHHIIISHQWKPCRPYSSIFHIRFPVLLVNRGWLWQVGLPKFFPSCAPLQGITKNLEDLSDTFTVLKSNKLCPEKKKKTLFSEEHHLSKSWLIRLPMMIVPWNKTIFHGVSKHYSPRNWGRSDSGHGQILHHGIDLGFRKPIAGACQFSGCLKVLGGLEAKKL